MTSATVEAPTRPERATTAGRYWWLLPVAIAICSRLFSLLLLARYVGDPGHPPTLIDDPSPLVAWDGQWYLHIAQTGYHAQPLMYEAAGQHDFAFYPAWPILIRIASLGGLLPMAGTAVVLANLLFIPAVAATYRYLVERFGAQTALSAVTLLAFNPAAYVFSMAYSESLFLLIAAVFFLDRFGRLSPVLGALAAVVRASGLAIGAAAAVVLVARSKKRLVPFLVCMSVALGFGLWWAYIWQLTGQFTGWLEGSPSFSLYNGFDSVVQELKTRFGFELLWGGFVLAMLVGSLLLVRRRPELGVYALVAIGLSIVGAPAHSTPRHAMVAFPAFAAIAERLGPRPSMVVAGLFAAGQFLFVDFAFGPLHRPP
jgi:Mannosyltransferase (PIG-V)